MTDRYLVIGHPIAHSKSPFIHAAFAAQTGQDLVYEAVLGDREHFEQQVGGLLRAGVRGLNVTLPFKERALALAARATPRARQAGAANTLVVDGALFADNTDGAGLLRDLEQRLRLPLAGRRLLVLGAGGAARGILGPLLQTGPACLHVHNRTPARAAQLCARFEATAGCSPQPLDDAQLAAQPAYDLVINATAASLEDAAPALPAGLFQAQGAAYDLAYRPGGDTAFLALARACGVALAVDGLGMLVEQAAEAFALWRGVRPDSEAVLRTLRAQPPAAS